MDEFNRLLTEYKNQYLQFLSSGDAAHKTAYQRVMKGIEDAINKKREQVDSQKRAMQHFVENYKKDNQTLSSLVSQAGGMAKSAQDLHDEYQTSKDRYDEWTSGPSQAPAIDVSNGYAIMLRFGIFLILIPVLIFVGYLGGGSSTFGYYPSSYGSSALSVPSTSFFSSTAIHNR